MSSPTFDSAKVTVIFVLGGPGAGQSFPSVTVFTATLHSQAKAPEQFLAASLKLNLAGVVHQ